METTTFETWKNVTIGTDDLIYTLINGVKIDQFEFNLCRVEIDYVRMNPNREEVDLVFVKHLSELGFDIQESMTYDQILKKAENLGLYPCPAEVAFQIVAQRKDKDVYPVSDPLIAMKPKGSKPYIFGLKRKDETLMVTAKDVQPYYQWSTFWAFIFCTRKF